jgi:hypothetical protein
MERKDKILSLTFYHLADDNFGDVAHNQGIQA